MKFIQMGIKYFKGISEEITITLPSNKKPLVIVGNNECGKTTILKGMEFIGKLCKDGTEAHRNLAEFKPRVMFFEGDMVFSALLELTSEELQELDSYLSEKVAQNKRQIKVVFTFRFDSDASECQEFTTDLWIAEEKIENKDGLLAIVSKSVPDILYYDDLFLEVPQKISFRKRGGDCSSQDEKTLFWQNILNDLLLGAMSANRKTSSLNGSTFRHYFVDWPEEQEMEIKQNLKSLNNYLTEVVSRDWEDNIGEESFFKGFEVIRDKDSADANVINFKFIANDEQNVFAISERSKGCRWFFCFKILTDIRQHRNRNGVIFLLDEPGSNLHVYPQEKILGSLEKLSSSENVSVIYTTHSHVLVPDEDDNLLVSRNLSEQEIAYPKIRCEKYDPNHMDKSCMPVLLKRMFTSAKRAAQAAPSNLSDLLKKCGACAEDMNNILELGRRILYF